MKAAGVKTGDADLGRHAACPDGLYVKRDFRWYEVLCRLMLDVVREFSPTVEYYSIDEFFFEATPPRGVDGRQLRPEDPGRDPGAGAGPGDRRHRPDADARQADLRHRQAVRGRGRPGPGGRGSRSWPGCRSRRSPASPGGGSGGCCPGASAPAWTSPMPTGGSSAQLLTATGEALWWELNGDPVLPIRPQRRRTRCSRGAAASARRRDSPMVLWAWLVRNLERLVEELEYHEVCTGPGGRLGRLPRRPGGRGPGDAWRPRATASTCCWTRCGPACGGRGSRGRRRAGCTCSPRTAPEGAGQLGLFDRRRAGPRRWRT